MRIKINKLFENITSLVSLRGAEYILNFILFPYLVRVLGVERFGAIVFMQGIVQYGNILVDYGFNLTGPRDIARANDKSRIACVFSNILVCKFLIFTVTTLGAFLIIALIHFCKYHFDSRLFWATYLLVAGNLIFPVWFFQGIQQMRYITIFNVIARSITVLLVFLFVKAPEDYVWSAFFQSGTLLLAGMFSLVTLVRRFKYVFVRPTWQGIVHTMKDGWHIFISTIAINLYTTTNTVVLGMLTDNRVVGYFSTANKLIESAKGIMFTFNQAVYPYVSSKLKNGQSDALRFIRKYFYLYSGMAFAGGVLLLLLAPIIITVLFGQGYDESVFLLRLMAFLPFIISISNVFGIQIMLNFGLQSVFSRILIIAAVLDLLLIGPFVTLWQGLGVVMVMIIVELTVTLIMAWYVLKIKRIPLFNS